MTTSTRQTLSLALSTLGLLAIMVAAALPLMRMAWSWFGWLYAAGAAVLLTGRLLQPVPKDATMRLKRLVRLEAWTALIFGAGAFFILSGYGSGNDWLAFTLAGGALTLYTSIMIPRQKRVKSGPEK